MIIGYNVVVLGLWEGLLSDNFCLRTGVNQGSVLAPLLFTICINELIRSSKKLSLGVIFVYADDILIISRTRHQLQLLFDHVQLCLLELNLCLNIDKTCCMRVGPRSYCKFADISAVNGSSIAWVNTIRYLGVFFWSLVNISNAIPVTLRSALTVPVILYLANYWVKLRKKLSCMLLMLSVFRFYYMGVKFVIIKRPYCLHLTSAYCASS